MSNSKVHVESDQLIITVTDNETCTHGRREAMV